MKKSLVTGAFGYSGKHITECLLKKGCKVVTLTGSTKRANPFGEAWALFSGMSRSLGRKWAA